MNESNRQDMRRTLLFVESPSGLLLGQNLNVVTANGTFMFLANFHITPTKGIVS